jgi:hypothetical protein
MSTWVKVARFNLARPAYYLLLPWILPLAFALGVLTARRSHEATGYLLSYFIFFGVQGWQTVSRSLPFGLALGASRRSFYSGTALLGMALALASGLVLAALQAIERATGERPVVRHLADLSRGPVRGVGIRDVARSREQPVYQARPEHPPYGQSRHQNPLEVRHDLAH